MKLAKMVRELQASHNARLIRLESKNLIIKFLLGGIAKLNDNEYLDTATTINANITPVLLPVDEWIRRITHIAFPHLPNCTRESVHYHVRTSGSSDTRRRHQSRQCLQHR